MVKRTDEMILSYKDVNLRQSDMALLSGTYYLNDRIIEFYLSYLSSTYPSEDILLLPPAIPFWIMHAPDIESVEDFLRPLNLSNRKLVIFPVNDNDDVTHANGGNHWSLLVYERQANVFVHHDSCPGLNKSHAKLLYAAVFRYMGKSDSGSEAGYLECDSTPRQENGYDCRLYVIAIARVICQWWFESNEPKDAGLWISYVKEQITPSAISNMRNEIIELIQNLRASTEPDTDTEEEL